jgi:hypothetical protein
MPRPKSHRRPPITSVLHAVLLQRDETMPLTPAEVADYDKRHRNQSHAAAPPLPSPSPVFSWERSAAPADNVVAFRAQSEATPPLAYAARAAQTVSPATRAQLARLVRELREEPKSPHA